MVESGLPLELPGRRHRRLLVRQASLCHNFGQAVEAGWTHSVPPGPKSLPIVLLPSGPAGTEATSWRPRGDRPPGGPAWCGRTGKGDEFASPGQAAEVARPRWAVSGGHRPAEKAGSTKSREKSAGKIFPWPPNIGTGLIVFPGKFARKFWHKVVGVRGRRDFTRGLRFFATPSDRRWDR